MDSLRPTKPNLRFGAFEIDLEAGELRKRGAQVRLQEQPFRLLCVLLEHPGQVITREELRRRIWPADTFVDFESSLNIAVLKIRQALGDSASRPRFIETVPKRGYRFVAPVAPAASTGQGAAKAATPDEPSDSLLTVDARAWRHVSKARQQLAHWLAGAMLAGGLGFGAFYLVSRGSRTAPGAWAAVPLTAFPGFEANPALSPDGKQVAFTWNGEKQDNFDIYVSTVPMRSGAPLAPLQLTTSPAHDFAPAWSPDGQKIAFLRQSGGDHGHLLVSPATGGPEHKLADIRNREIALMRVMSPSWSPDGQWVAASHREAGDETEGIYAFSVTGTRQRLTAPPRGYHGDYMPAFSPDGNALAFCRLGGFSTSEIHLLPLGANLLPKAAPRSVTNLKRWSVNPVWIRDGRSILHVFSEHPGTRRELRVISISGSTVQTQAVSIPDEPAEVTAGASLVYSRRVFDTNIWRARIPAAGDPPAVAERFISSTQSDEKPSYSPDGRKIAFVSRRSGSDEIWISNADGANPVQMTFFGGPLVGLVRWSPDGQRIVFHARPDGQADLFVIPAVGGSPMRLTSNASDDTLPSYSRDGRWIYFISRRSGYPSIWKMPSEGGEAIQLTASQSTMPVESVDGTTVYYYKWPEPNEIWSAPVHGGPPEKITGPTHAYPFGFTVTAEGIYYPAPPHAGEERFIRFFQFSTRRSHPVVMTNRSLRLGMSISPDGRFILFDQLDDSGSDLMLVRDFRPR